MAQMTRHPMRIYATNVLESEFPGRGSGIENIIFEITKEDLALSGCKGMDFYPFRKKYKNRLQSILENLANDASQLKESLQKVGDLDHVHVVLSNNPKEWNRKLWALDEDDEEKEQDEPSEMREGTFDCTACARKGLYSKNTSDYQRQTRSADEPMTIFMHCHTCGKNYRFSS